MEMIKILKVPKDATSYFKQTIRFLHNKKIQFVTNGHSHAFSGRGRLFSNEPHSNFGAILPRDTGHILWVSAQLNEFECERITTSNITLIYAENLMTHNGLWYGLRDADDLKLTIEGFKNKTIEALNA